MDLDLVDLDATLAEQAATVARACENIGFFRIPLTTVAPSVADEAWRTAQEFFALPVDEKRGVGFPEPGYPYGWSPYRFEALARSLDYELSSEAGPDLKESFSVGPDCGVGPLTSGSPWIRSPTLWPQRPVRLRPAWVAYYRAMAEVSEHLMAVMAVALDLPPDYFAPLIDRPISAMRANHYPAVGAAEPAVLRAGAHSDYGTLTILRTDDVAGLEIEGADGAWHVVEPRPDTLVVNLGDSVARWTNDRWRSTVHRVSAVERSPRQSMAFFHMANWDASIECLPTCVPSGEAARYEPVRAGPWLMNKFQSTVP